MYQQKKTIYLQISNQKNKVLNPNKHPFNQMAQLVDS